MARWPKTEPVFRRYQMACAGCVMAPFCTVADAIKIYGADEAVFLAELKALMDPSENAAPPLAPEKHETVDNE